MRTLILILLALFFAIGLGTVLSRETGLMIFSYSGYNVQMSLSTFVLGLLLVFLLTYIVFRLLGGAYRLPKNISRWSRHRRHRRSEKHLGQGILAVLEGDWQRAEKCFQSGAVYSRLPLANYLAAARAAQKLGAIDRRDHYLRLAHADSPEAVLAIGLTQARLQLAQKQTEEAYATLKHLSVSAAEQGRVNALLLAAATELKEWPDALRLLNDPGLKKIIPAEQLNEEQQAVQGGIIRDAGIQGDRQLLESTWENLPRKLKKDGVLLAEYVEARLNFPGTADCEHLLRKRLGAVFDARLVGLYGQVRAENVIKQIQFAEKLLQNHAGEVSLLLCLGRLCKAHSLWGKARSYLRDAINTEPSVEAYQELALLLEQQGEHAEAAVCFRKGLALATGYEQEGPGNLLAKPPGNESQAGDARKAG